MTEGPSEGPVEGPLGIGVIDLDVAGSRPPELAPEGRRRNTRRARLLTGLTALALVLLGGAAAPGVPRVHLVATVSGSTGIMTVALTTDTLFVMPEVGGQQMLTAYAVPGGAARWRADVGVVQVLRPAATSGVLLAYSYTDGPGGMVSVIDMTTGAIRWVYSFLGIDAQSVDRGVLVMSARTNNGHTEITQFDLRTGQSRWTRLLPGDSALRTVDPTGRTGPRRVVVTTPAGEVVVLDEATGAVVTRRQLHVVTVRADGTTSPIPTSVNVIGDRVYLLSQSMAVPGELSAYDLDTLADQWRVAGVIGPAPMRCGPVICVSDANSLLGIDPGTGAVRWTQPRWVTAIGQPDGRLLVSSLVNGPTDEIGLLDAATGGTLLRLSGWTPIVLPATGRVVFGSSDTASRSNGTLLAVLAPSMPTIVPLGVLAGVSAPDKCAARASLLACPTPDHQVRVWRYRT